MIKTTADDMHFYLSNIETGKFSDLILPNDNPPDLGQGGRQGGRRDPNGARDETIIELENEYSQKFTKIQSELDFLDKITELLQKGQYDKVKQAKDLFYLRYFNTSMADGLEDIVKEYVKGVQFVMYYYYRGCPSWSWCYPYFISPFAGDIVETLDELLRKDPGLDFEFDLASPLEPFKQLMYILPRASLDLLPQPHVDIIMEENSPIAKYYPEKFELEPFDNIKDYQWIPLIEQINSNLINQELLKIDQSQLTELELKRNQRNKTILYEWNSKNPMLKFKTTMPDLEDFESRISMTELPLDAFYEFDYTKLNTSIEGFEIGNLPSFHSIPDVRGQLKMFGRRNKYERVCIIIKQDQKDGDNSGAKKAKTALVYYSWPHKKLANVNLQIGPWRPQAVGFLPSRVYKSIEDQSKSKKFIDIYFKCIEAIKDKYYTEMAIIFEMKENGGLVYELERPMKNMRMLDNKITYSYKNVDLLFPHVLLSQTGHTKKSLMNANQAIFQVYQPGSTAIDLRNGDMVKITQPMLSEETIKVKLLNRNVIGTKKVGSNVELCNEVWLRIDENFLEDVGLTPNEAYILHTIIDSFQIKTDINKSSSLILGEFFDIGLQFFRIRNNKVEDTVFVPDIVMLSRHREYGPNLDNLDYCIRQQKYDGNFVYYDIWVIPKAKDTIVEYIKEFPDIIDYLRLPNVRNDIANSDMGKKYHTVHDLYKETIKADKDPNIHLFKVYSWLLKNEISSLKLYSGLS